MRRLVALDEREVDGADQRYDHNNGPEHRLVVQPVPAEVQQEMAVGVPILVRSRVGQRGRTARPGDVDQHRAAVEKREQVEREPPSSEREPTLCARPAAEASPYES